MVTVTEYNAETHTLEVSTYMADAAGGELVLPGSSDEYTDDEIRDAANAALCAPECGDFCSAAVARR